MMTDDTPEKTPETTKLPKPEAAEAGTDKDAAPSVTGEVGGPEGPEPTRYGDWEKKGRCIDF